ncbi:MAG: hypothetical protein V3T48_08215, partial [Vicinamibacterales bacterium]
QAALSAGGTNADNDAATTGNDAAQTDASGNQTSVDSAAGNDTTPEPETPAATVPGAATTPQPPPQANAGDVGADRSAQAPPTQTATEQAAQATAQQPQPAQAQPVQPQPAQPEPAQPQPQVEEPAVVAPPINSIVAVTSGEYEYVDLVNTWFEGAFADQQFEVIDFRSSPYATLPEAARFHVITTATLISARPLEYFGNIQTQYTVSLTTRVTDLTNGVTVVGPETETFRYTSINMVQNFERATGDLARSLAMALRELIHTP